MGLTDVRVAVSNPAAPSRARTLKFLVDSGAIYSVRPVGQAAFTFGGRTRTSPVMFGEPGDAMLLGVMTLEALGLMLDPVKQELRKMLLRV